MTAASQWTSPYSHNANIINSAKSKIIKLEFSDK